MTAYYNEHDPYAAQWLRNLIAAGHIAPGDVDERSIEDVRPSDLRGYVQCHFFAGIGVWSYALRRAGWGDDRPVWTGSCPCQPFSAAGKGAGFSDERHLWPAFHWLIQECRPPALFGEQVAGASVGPWIDLVQADLEGLGYAFGVVPFPAAGIGAPHIRDRLYWMAHASGKGLEGRNEGEMGRQRETAERSGSIGGLGDSPSERCGEARLTGGGHQERLANASATDGTGPLDGYWRDADWLYCRDEKWRPVEPGTFPLADGIADSLGRGKSTLGGMARSNRVGRLKGYGNAINAEAARVFIQAAMQCKKGKP